MRNIETKKMLELWDRLLWLEKASDFELANRAGLSYGTISNWRGEKPPRVVRLSTLGEIERNLGYKIELGSDGKWDIQKLSPAVNEGSIVYDPSIHFSMPGHVSEEEAERYRQLVKRLGEIPPDEVDKVIEMIDLLFRKKKN